MADADFHAGPESYLNPDQLDAVRSPVPVIDPGQPLSEIPRQDLELTQAQSDELKTEALESDFGPPEPEPVNTAGPIEVSENRIAFTEQDLGDWSKCPHGIRLDAKIPCEVCTPFG